VRIGDLSRRSGVAVATLKYYLREALLHPGVMTAVNQADYDQSHLQRVALVRALLEAGQLRIADVRKVLAAVEAEDVTIHQAFGIAQDAMVPDRDRSSGDYEEARAEVDRFVARHGLRVRPGANVNALLADALALIRAFGFCGPGASVADGAALLDPLVAAAVEQATAEVALVH
jgi:DNA-binding transcriptional MerR regulator